MPSLQPSPLVLGFVSSPLGCSLVPWGYDVTKRFPIGPLPRDVTVRFPIGSLTCDIITRFPIDDLFCVGTFEFD